MKTTLPLLALFAGQVLAADSPLPTAYSAERYEKMIDKSPFALATPPVAPVAPQAGFAAYWYLTGVGRDEKGEDFATILSKDLAVHFSLFGHDAHVETGVSIASVKWSDTSKKTVVTLKKGTEFGDVMFNPDETAMVMPQPGMKPGGPGGLTLPPVMVRPVGGGQPLPPVTQQPRIALPRPGGVSAVTQPVVTPAGAQPEGENRRRVRNIAAPQ